MHLRSEMTDRKFKAYLVIAFARTAMAYRVSAFLQGDLNESLGDQRSCMACAKQISLVLGACFQTRHNIIIDIFFCQIEDIQLGSACFQSFLFQAVQFIPLSDIARYGNDFTVVVVFLQPGNDHGCVQASAVRQHYFFDIFTVHNISPSAIQKHDCFVLYMTICMDVPPGTLHTAEKHDRTGILFLFFQNGSGRY